MKRIINTLKRKLDPEIVEGFRELLKIYSLSCVVADSMERAGVMHSSIKPLFDSRFVGVALTMPGRQPQGGIPLLQVRHPLHAGSRQRSHQQHLFGTLARYS